MNPILINWLIGLGGFLALLWVAKNPIKFLYNLTVKAHDLVELLYGDPSDPEKPGLDKRLTAFEEGQQSAANTLLQQSATLSEMRHELKPNGGSSMNDRLTRVEKVLNPSAPDNH